MYKYTLNGLQTAVPNYVYETIRPKLDLKYSQNNLQMTPK